MNGKNFQATETLASALRHLRHPKNPRVLWVDALCIDTNARNYVTKRIESIHNRAQEGVVWLGNESNTSRRAFAFMKELEKALMQKSEEVDPIGDQTLERLTHDSSYGPSWDSIQELVNRPWWNRVWILRKSVLPSKIMVQCGDDVTDWKTFILLFSLLKKIQSNGRRFGTRYPTQLNQITLQFSSKLQGHFMEGWAGPNQEGLVSLGKAISSYFERMVSCFWDGSDWIQTACEDLTDVGRLLNSFSTSLSSRYKRRGHMKFLESIAQENMADESEAAVLETEQGADLNGIEPASQDIDPAHNMPSSEKAIPETKQTDDMNDLEPVYSKPKWEIPVTAEADVADVECWLRILTVMSNRTKQTGCRNGLDPAISKAEQRAPCMSEKENEEASLNHTLFMDFEYAYERLDLNKQEIRVLQLYPNDDPAAEIHCDLIPLDLGLFTRLGVGRFPYMALSYVWGKFDPPKTIFVHGRKKTITPNLFAALRQFRDPSIPLLLWVDALCIDQNNAEERNHQVGLMSLIYKKAGSVLMWLGEEEHNSKVAMEYLTFLEVESGLGGHRLDPKSKPAFMKLAKDAGSTIRWVALNELLRRPYWTRLWIMQEVVLANDAILCCGPYTASFMVLLAFRKFIGHFPIAHGPLDEPEEQAPVRRLADLCGRLADGLSQTLFNALLLGRDRFATDTRDYVYGMLGIADLKSISLSPDYGKSLFSVSREAFQCIVQQDGSLDVLSACKRTTRDDSLHDHNQIQEISNDRVSEAAWPSWLPDWSSKPKYRSSYEAWSILLTEKGRDCYKAAEGTGPRIAFADDKRLCTVDGLLFDVVQYVSQHIWPASANNDWVSFSQFARRKNIYGSAHAQKTAFAQTVLLAQYNGREDPLDDIISFACGIVDVTFDEEAVADLNESENCEPNNIAHNNVRQGIQSATERINDNGGIEDLKPDNVSEDVEEEGVMRVFNSFSCALHQGRFFITSRGYIGRGPVSTQMGDQVCVFLGAKVPFVLRENEETKQYHLLGESCKCCAPC
jgi:hypothetical protein